MSLIAVNTVVELRVLMRIFRSLNLYFYELLTVNMATRTDHLPTYTDQSLYQALLKNESTAFEYIYKKNFPAVRQQVQQYGGSEDDAKDIFQEGVIALWNNIRSGSYQLRENVKMSTYLIQICKLRWMDRTKKASHRYEMKKEDYVEPAAEAEVLTDWIDREDQQQFQRQFAQLGERCQDLLKRFYFVKESLQEIAQAMGIGEATAKNEKYRCMQRLKKIVLS